MSMSTTEDWPPSDEVIELEPTLNLDVANPLATGSLTSLRPGVAMAEGTLASLAGETDTLRRRRLFAASVFLAGTFGLLAVWVFASDNPGTLTAEGNPYSLRVGLIGLRCLLAAAVAGLLASEAPLTRKQLRVVEYVLFLGVTLTMMASQYFVGLDLAHRGTAYAPIILAFIKDGVIQMMALMMIYGTLIPNAPAVAARVLVAMFIGPVAVLFLLGLHPDVAPIVAQLGEAEEAGSNILFLAIGMALAIYGSFLVNGLRTQLHQARKFGQYQLMRKLGEGGMGEVYLAEHQLLKRPCALKLIKAEAGSDPIALARFEREVQSAARLRHPNTIEIYDYGHTDDGTFYYVMEYLEGLSLSDLVRQAGPLPPGRVIYIFRQVCAGLAEAHALGLVHRDLKPANVFVAVRGGESDVAKVLDFGLVKLTRDPGAVELTRRDDGQRHADVHGARAGRRRPLARRQGRHLRPGRDDVFRPDRPAAVHGREPLRRDDGPCPRPRRAPLAAPPRSAGGSRTGDPPLPREEARRSLPQRQGPGRCPGRVPLGGRLGTEPGRRLVGLRDAARAAPIDAPPQFVAAE